MDQLNGTTAGKLDDEVGRVIRNSGQPGTDSNINVVVSPGPHALQFQRNRLDRRARRRSKTARLKPDSAGNEPESATCNAIVVIWFGRSKDRAASASVHLSN